jgi:hypothetical protein
MHMANANNIHSHPSQIDKTTLMKNLLDFSRSRDQGLSSPRGKSLGTRLSNDPIHLS